VRKINNQYLVGHNLNEGGTATVYFGINQYTGFPVAIKELNPKLFADPTMLGMFKGEANRYLYLEHKNIVKLEDLILLQGQETGYLIMEYIEGDNLKDYLRNVTGAMPIEMAAAFMIEALDALSFAHRQGVVHLDIKPGNIMLCSRTNNIKLIDFGISIELSRQRDSTVMGTPYYMSPEQLAGQDFVDFRSDIYSVGITLYELIKGRTPFAYSQTKDELKTNIQTVQVPSILEAAYPVENNLLPLVNKIIKKATEKNPQDRYKDCDEFKKELQQLIG
jgi:serine/threonine-protein kinase